MDGALVHPPWGLRWDDVVGLWYSLNPKDTFVLTNYGWPTHSPNHGKMEPC